PAFDCSQRNSVPLNFEVAHKYQQAGRAVRALKTYTITRYSSTFLAMGYRGSEAAQLKEDYIAAFNAMEERLKNGPKTHRCHGKRDGQAGS
ncbi:MAG: Rha family transcriptional regulator, partial [Desulfobacterales bacterium]|nr:Rha family transcriptional regulator [Desulfobacterales bacterium]